MHGLIFVELKQFADARFGPDVWDRWLDASGLGPKAYSPTHPYPDAELMALIAAGAGQSGLSRQKFLEEFGRAVGPQLVILFGTLLEHRWRTLDVVEHTERLMHTSAREGGGTPPYLRIERLSRGEVHVHYDSPRRLCAFARGIVFGIAAHFGENIGIEEPTCMRDGAAECTLVVRQLPA